MNQPPEHPARYGMAFRVGDHSLFIGPNKTMSGPPVLAYTVPRMREPEIVATFKNSSTAERTIAAIQGIFDMTNETERILTESNMSLRFEIDRLVRLCNENGINTEIAPAEGDNETEPSTPSPEGTDL